MYPMLRNYSEAQHNLNSEKIYEDPLMVRPSNAQFTLSDSTKKNIIHYDGLSILFGDQTFPIL